MPDAQRVAVLCRWAGWPKRLYDPHRGTQEAFVLDARWEVRGENLYFLGFCVGPALNSGEFAGRLLRIARQNEDFPRSQLYYLLLGKGIDDPVTDREWLCYADAMYCATPRAICKALFEIVAKETG